MTIFEFIDLMKLADLSKISYNKIKSIIINNNIKVPYTTSILKKGTPIERGRLNDGNEFYNSEFEISYRTDYGNIKEFGRANEPFRARFYGAILSKEISLARITLFCELEEKFHDNSLKDYESNMTIGRWVLKEDIEVASVWLSDDYLKVEELNDQFKLWNSKLKGTEIGQDQFIGLLKYFSKEFSKTQIETHHDYKLSCIYTDLAIFGNNLKGVLYPSVKSDYRGFNIVMEPRDVEKYLALEKVAMFRYEVKKGEPILYPTYLCEDLGSLNSKFRWRAVVKPDL